MRYILIRFTEGVLKGRYAIQELTEDGDHYALWDMEGQEIEAPGPHQWDAVKVMGTEWGPPGEDAGLFWDAIRRVAELDLPTLPAP